MESRIPSQRIVGAEQPSLSRLTASSGSVGSVLRGSAPNSLNDARMRWCAEPAGRPPASRMTRRSVAGVMSCPCRAPAAVEMLSFMKCPAEVVYTAAQQAAATCAAPL